MSHVLGGAEEECFADNSATHRISCRHRVSAFREDFGEVEEAVGICLDGHVRKRTVGRYFHTCAGGRNAIRQEHLAGENAGDGIDQLEIKVNGLPRTGNYSLCANLCGEEGLRRSYADTTNLYVG